MSPSRLTIRDLVVTPVAFADPPLLNQVGVHEPFALRAVLEVHTDAGIVGLGETYGDAPHLQLLDAVRPNLVGRDTFDLNGIRSSIAADLAGRAAADRHGLTGAITSSGTLDRVFAGIEVACLDAQGRAVGRPVSDLLGGAVRDRVPYSAYLFYKWAGHPGQPPDAWGECLTPQAIVAQARQLVGDYGFTAIKLKGGVLPPRQEIDAVLALRDEFPDLPLRLDPNAGWTPETSIMVGTELAGVLEYLEDPTPGIPGMAAVARAVPMPLATNMCVVEFAHIPPAIAQSAVGVILSDHHYWGGLRRSRRLAGVCETFGLGLSMHSNSHLGISLAAMTHLAAATPELTYACDTHWPWKGAADDVIVPGVLSFVDGSVAVPRTPGLGVELDRDALAHRHETYLRCGLRRRDDTAYMKRLVPDWLPLTPRW
jgi:glucarate dehydratase